MRQVILAAALLALGASLAVAQSWKVDPAHSRVEFAVTYLMMSEVTGRFTAYEVDFTQGSEDFSGSTVAARIKIASVNTENEKRDAHLRSDDFFNAEKYPDMVFESTSFEKSGDGVYRIAGDLTIRDVTRPVVLDAKYLGMTKDAWGNTRAGFKATASINRMDYGVRWNKALDSGGTVVSEDVAITLVIQLTKETSR
jgi:polyisoprenoid-binding protein YceI